MKVFLVFIITVLFYQAEAQRCGTEEYLKQHQLVYNSHPNTPLTVQGARDTFSNEVIVIPVVIHILYHTAGENISDAQVLSQIDALNKDYRRKNEDAENTPIPFQQFAADTRIVFCLAKVDPQGRYTSGIVRKYTKYEFWLSDDEMKFSSRGGDDAWDATKYLNIWVCNLFGRTLGYGVFPGGPSNSDGVVMQYNVFGTKGALNPQFNKGRTAVHEIGHWLGLKHLWGDASCGDDGVYDTPQQQTNNSYCPLFPRKSLCSPDENGDMFMNYMDFTDDACMNLFTKGQKEAMRAQFAKGGFRNSILTSTVCDSTNAQAGPMPEETSDGIAVSVYPNPFTTEVVINTESFTQLPEKTLKLYDVAGRLHLTQKLRSQKTTLRLSNLKAGVYFIKIESGQSLSVHKIIKQ